jgi:hypothetical protein
MDSVFQPKPPLPPAHAKQVRDDMVARRRTPRRAYHRTAGVLVGGRFAVFEGRSLSEGGIGVTISDDPDSQRVIEKISSGAKVVVSIILPSGAALILRGVVVHHGSEKATEHSIGIKFEAFALNQRREIRYYVSAKAAGEAAR